MVRWGAGGNPDLTRKRLLFVEQLLLGGGFIHHQLVNTVIGAINVAKHDIEFVFKWHVHFNLLNRK